MFKMNRKVGGSVFVGGDVVFRVLGITPEGEVRLGIIAPSQCEIVGGETVVRRAGYGPPPETQSADVV